jgi:hypothetical protein
MEQKTTSTLNPLLEKMEQKTTSTLNPLFAPLFLKVDLG